MSDLISRQAAIDALGEKPLDWTDGEYELGLQNQWKYDVDAIKALPPVTPGHWINIDKTHSKCDKCGSIFEIVSVNGESNYCPNCGCFMSKGGKE